MATALCQRLAAGSHYVIRFDHRDVGFSSEFGDDATYTYEDMSDDVVGLLDALGIAAAHVVGVSMGGAIAQIMAVRQPTHVLSLTSISSGPYAAGDTDAPAGLAARLSLTDLMGDHSRRRARAGSRSLSEQIARRVWGDWPFDEEAVRESVEQKLRARRPTAGRGPSCGSGPAHGVSRRGVAAAERTYSRYPRRF